MRIGLSESFAASAASGRKNIGHVVTHRTDAHTVPPKLKRAESAGSRNRTMLPPMLRSDSVPVLGLGTEGRDGAPVIEGTDGAFGRDAAAAD